MQMNQKDLTKTLIMFQKEKNPLFPMVYNIRKTQEMYRLTNNFYPYPSLKWIRYMWLLGIVLQNQIRYRILF